MPEKNLDSVKVLKKVYSRFGCQDVEKLNIFWLLFFTTLGFNYLNISFLKYYLSNNNNSTLDFFHKTFVIYGFYLGSCVSTSTFMIYILNNYFLDCRFWNYFTEKDYNVKNISTSEKRLENKLVRYPINTYSSTFLFNAGIYFFLRSESVINQEATFNLGILMNIMGLFSIMWWASGKEYIRKLDNLFMEIHTIYTVLTYVTILDVEYTKYINVLILLYMYFRYLFIENAKVLVIFIFEIILGNLVMIKIGNVGNEKLYYLSNAMLMLGFYFKIKDHVLNFKYGTGFLHLFAPLSIILHFEWSQSLIQY